MYINVDTRLSILLLFFAEASQVNIDRLQQIISEIAHDN